MLPATGDSVSLSLSKVSISYVLHGIFKDKEERRKLYSFFWDLTHKMSDKEGDKSLTLGSIWFSWLTDAGTLKARGSGM